MVEPSKQEKKIPRPTETAADILSKRTEKLGEEKLEGYKRMIDAKVEELLPGSSYLVEQINDILDNKHREHLDNPETPENIADFLAAVRSEIKLSSENGTLSKAAFAHVTAEDKDKIAELTAYLEGLEADLKR